MILPFAQRWPSPPSPRKNGPWAASSSSSRMTEDDEASEGEAARRKVKALNRSLRLALGSQRLLGSMPFCFDEVREEYRLSWRSFSGLHMLATATWLTLLFGVTTYSLFAHFLCPLNWAAGGGSQTRANSTGRSPTLEAEGRSPYQTRLMGVVIIYGCLFNAWVEVLNGVRTGRRTCRLVNTWLAWVANAGTEATAGLRHFSVGVPIFVYTFIGVIFFIVIFSSPRMVVQTGEALSQVMFLQPERSGGHQPLPAVIGVGVVVVHVFLVYKGAVVMFMTNCRLLANAFIAWRNHVARSLEEAWSSEYPGASLTVPLKELLQNHWRLVQLVRETEAIYSYMMMAYYASTVVMLCAELYLVAYRLSVGLRYSKEEAVCQTLIIGQTSVTFLLVSMSASAVHDEAEGSVDVVRRGMPFNATESDKFHMHQLQLAVMGAPIYLTGGKFFAIHRPFILTVMSAVVSYFIIILQLNMPVLSAEREARDLTVGAP